MKNKKLIGDIILFIVLLVPFVFIIVNKINNNKLIEYVYVDDLSNLSEPIQEEYDEDIVYKNLDYKYDIHLKYTYSIRGRVVETRKYMPTTIIGALAPIDIGMVWDKYTKDEYLSHIKFINYGDRFLWYRISSEDYNDDFKDLDKSFSNNHLVPSNKKVLKQLKLIKEGDYIELEGYLIDAAIKKHGVEWHLNSSITRDDTGDGACETIYVTGVKWLKEKEY